ncbi:MAG: hypothetical protein QM739_16565 [Propionivibrio sp.]
MGHTWITISDGNTTTSYGYYPKPGFDYVFGDPGEVRKNYDDAVHLQPDFKQEISISEDQYNAISKFAEEMMGNPPGYDVTGVGGGNCASFVQSATNAGGISDIPDYLKSPFPWFLPTSYRSSVWSGAGDLTYNQVINSSFLASRKTSSPLVLDLDGDGVEIRQFDD